MCAFDPTQRLLPGVYDHEEDSRNSDNRQENDLPEHPGRLSKIRTLLIIMSILI